MLKKVCGGCGIEKPPNEFYRRSNGSSDGLQQSCKICQRDQRRKSRRRAAEPRKPHVPDDLPGEIWRPVIGYEGLYSISSVGRVRSEERTVYRTDGRTQLVHARFLTAVPDRKGYLRVSLFRDNVGETCYVHQMVMCAFVGPCQSGDLVLHFNGDCSDNRLPNLRYGSLSENQLDAVRHGTHRNSKKDRCPHGHAYDAANTYVDGRGSRRCRTCMRTRRGQRIYS